MPDRLWEGFLEQAALCKIPGAGRLVEDRLRSKPLHLARGDMRMRVCDYFAAVHDESGIPLMVELAELESDRFLTMQSLLALNPDAALPHLMRWAENGSGETMQWATHFLCEHSRGRPNVLTFLESELLRNRKRTRSFCIRTLSQARGSGANASILQTLERLIHEVRRRDALAPGTDNGDKALILCVKHFAGANRIPAFADVAGRLGCPDMLARLTDAEKEAIGLTH